VKRSRRLSVVSVILLLLRIGVAVAVVLGTWATLSAGRLDPSEWRDLFIFGIAQGSVYALIALGYTLVYGVLLMINFAHGDVFMFGGMTGFFVADALGKAGWWRWCRPPSSPSCSSGSRTVPFGGRHDWSR
jgi:branched-chain amino acid transport system permease protein